MRARFDGECPTCDGSIYEGEEIVKRPRGWSHPDCVDYRQPERPDVVCEVCNLAMPCWCPPAVQAPQGAAAAALARYRAAAARDPFEGFL